MKKMILILLITAQFANSQTDSSAGNKKKQFVATVVNDSLKTRYKGLLYHVGDSGLTIQQNIRTTRGIQTEWKLLPPAKIESVTLKRKNAGLKGALIGAGVGLAAGVVIGFVSGDDPVHSYPAAGEDFFGLGTLSVAISNAFALTAGQKALYGGIGGMTSGALVGALIGGLAKKKFVIGGKKEKFQEMKQSVLEIAYNPQERSL
jgi:hypothetical protein